MDENFPAHIRKEKSNDGCINYVIQSVAEHCRNTAKYASESLKIVGLEKTAYLAGLLHDCGKCTDSFKKYIEDVVVRGFDIRRGSVNHTFAGFRYILSKQQTGNDIRNFTIELIAYAIGAHHGLFDCLKENNESAYIYRIEKSGIDYENAIGNFFQQCASEDEIEKLLQQATMEVNNIVSKIIHIESSEDDTCEIAFYYSLLCRLLTSAVITGDRKDTAEFEKNKIMRRENIDFAELLDKFDSYISSLKNKYPVDAARKKISDDCFLAAQKPESIYRLNVPTGGGKTLSSLRYALAHSQKYHKQRIFFVMPLLAIIEQNAKEIRKAIKNDSIILEHHSNVINEVEEDEEELDKRELFLQSWDAPIIITTLVQFLNTLFLGKTTSIRRFTALSNSVIVFDEVQSVPNNMLTLYNLAINFLVKICHATVILCSATQPCLEKVEHKLLPEISDLINVSEEVLRIFKRVELVDKGTMTEEELTNFAAGIIDYGKSLLLVCNTKKEANEFFINLQTATDMKIPIYHLSASMCTVHRTAVVEAMKNDIQQGRKIVCVSTQVIEAGVDISFNSVIRLQAGMDNIIQTAGRCNRNGENNNLESVYIVRLVDENLSMLVEIEKAKTATESLLQVAKYDKEYSELMSDAAIEYYYKRLYGAMDEGYQDFKIPKLGKSLYELLNRCNEILKPDGPDHFTLAQQFKTAGKYFQIFNDDTFELLVPYGKGQEIIAELGSEQAKHDIGYTAEVIKEATGYTVACYKYQIDILEKCYAIEYNCTFGIYVLVNTAYYDEKLGLNLNAVGGDGLFI